MVMVRWICLLKLADVAEQRNRLNLYNMQWFGHLQRMDVSTWPRKAPDIQVAGRNPRRRPRMARKECIQTDMRVKGLKTSQTQDRETWRQAIKPPRRHEKDSVQPLVTGNNAQ